MKNLAAPWCEFAVPGQISFFVHWTYVTELEKPSEVLGMWNTYLIAANKFNGWTDGQRPRKEMVSFDKQISAGD